MAERKSSLAAKGDQEKDDESETSKKTETVQTKNPSPLLVEKEARGAEATKAREGSHKFFRGTFLTVFLIATGLLAIVVFGYTVLPSGGGGMNVATGLFWGSVLIVGSFFVPKIKKKEWLPGALRGIGMLVIVMAIAFSGFGQKVARTIDQAEACLVDNDCETRAEDFPTIHDGGTVEFETRKIRTFHVEGEVLLVNNNVGYCLNIGPPGVFEQRPEAGGRHVYITSVSGENELAVVQLRPRAKCSS